MNSSNSDHEGDPCPKCGWQSKPVTDADRFLGRHNSRLTCEEVQHHLKQYLRMLGFKVE